MEIIWNTHFALHFVGNAVNLNRAKDSFKVVDNTLRTEMASQELPETLWTKVQQLPQDAMRQVQCLYGPRFPIEVRHFFADWIEAQPWLVRSSNHTRLFSTLQQIALDILGVALE